MKIRQVKRWCDQCKAMVFSRGHEHGQEVEVEQVIDDALVKSEVAADMAQRGCASGICPDAAFHETRVTIELGRKMGTL